MDSGDIQSQEVSITIQPKQQPVDSTSKVTKPFSEKSALVKSYFFLKLKRKKTEDATDINEVEKNGEIVAVTACKSSSECGNNFCLGADNRTARHFHYSIVEPFGEEILTIKGYQSFFGSAEATFTRGRSVLGKITYPGKGNNYDVLNSSGDIIFNIRKNFDSTSCCGFKSFDVSLPNNTSSSSSSENTLGKIGSGFWDTSSVPFCTNKNDFGISYPTNYESDNDKHWILLASSLLLRWQFWRPINNTLWFYIYILLILLTVLAIVALSVSFVV